jgi:hypothetical protein
MTFSCVPVSQIGPSPGWRILKDGRSMPTVSDELEPGLGMYLGSRARAGHRVVWPAYELEWIRSKDGPLDFAVL